MASQWSLFPARSPPLPPDGNTGVDAPVAVQGLTNLDKKHRLETGGDMKQQEVAVEAHPSVDWLTVTSRTPASTYDLIRVAMAQIGDDKYLATESRPWHFQGFKGTSVEGACWGTRGDEGIVILSGARCGLVWPVVAPRAERCSRIDLAVTVTLVVAQEGVATRGYGAALDKDVCSASIILNSRGGQTLYLGSRTSRYFGRLYDKSAEQGQAPGAVWRYEVENKKPSAFPLLQSLMQSKEPGAWIGAYVWGWFAERGVTPMFARKDVNCAIEISGVVHSAERSLKWLSSQVKPTVQKLLIDGYGQEVYEALMLPGFSNGHSAQKDGV